MNNLQIQTIFALFALLLFSPGCSKDRGNTNPCPTNFGRDLVLTIEDEYTSSPSQVSIFFKADDKNGMPVPGLVGGNFTIYEKGRNDLCEKQISNFEAKADISNRDKLFSYSTLLLLDLSGSVTSSTLPELKVAAKAFIDEVMPAFENESYTMAIYWFDGEDVLHSLKSLTSDKETLKSAVDALHPEMSNDPSTDLFGAVIKAVDRAEALFQANFETAEIISASSIVIFTDGTDQAGRYAKQNAFDAVNRSDSKIRLYTIGLGEEIDENVLRTIGKSGFVFAADQAELIATFSEVAEVVWAEANSYYLFEYCSPKRDGSGINSLRIEATAADGRSGSVQTTFDATEFTGGCD